MARHLKGYVPDNPRYRPITQDEMCDLFCGDWLSGTACETCRHRVTVKCGSKNVRGYERMVEKEVCVEAHDNGYEGNCYELNAQTVMDTCPLWEMEE